MKVIVCETMAAIVAHLRVDDGPTRYLGGGLRCHAVLLCKPRPGNIGWDTRMQAPASPADARARTQYPRFCSVCVDRWEEALRQAPSESA